MTLSRISSVLLLSLTLGLTATACQKEPGPAEKAGAKIDDAAGDVKAAAKEAKDDVKKELDH